MTPVSRYALTISSLAMDLGIAPDEGDDDDIFELEGGADGDVYSAQNYGGIGEVSIAERNINCSAGLLYTEFELWLGDGRNGRHFRAFSPVRRN